MKYKLCIFLSLSAISSSLFAASHFYTGLGIGYGSIDSPNKNIFGDVSSSATISSRTSDVGGLAGRFFLGYRYNRHLGFELGFNKSADSNYATKQTNSSVIYKASLRLKQYQVNALAKFIWPLGHPLSVYGLAGLTYINQCVHYKPNSSISISSGDIATPDTGNKSYSGISPTLGAGINFDLSKRLSAGLEFQHTFKKDNTGSSKSALFASNYLLTTLTYKL